MATKCDMWLNQTLFDRFNWIVRWICVILFLGKLRQLMQCVATVRMRNANTSVPYVLLVNEQVCNVWLPLPLGCRHVICTVNECMQYWKQLHTNTYAHSHTHTHNCNGLAYSQWQCDSSYADHRYYRSCKILHIVRNIQTYRIAWGQSTHTHAHAHSRTLQWSRQGNQQAAAVVVGHHDAVSRGRYILVRSAYWVRFKD